MTALISEVSAKTALYTLRQEGRQEQGRAGEVLGGTFDAGKGARPAGAFFSISSAFRSESTILRALDEGLGRARSSVAAARSGSAALGGILGEVETVIAAVENGAPGSALTGSLGKLRQDAAQTVAAAGFGGTNLLQEGETLTVTLGFDQGRDHDFRRQSFTAIGLAATDGAKAASRTVAKVVSETVETPVTLGERLSERAERLAERQVRIANRETRLESRLEKIAERQERLESRLERLQSAETRITERIAAETTFDDPRKAKAWEKATKFLSKKQDMQDKGNTGAAAAHDRQARKAAAEAGVDLGRFERMQNRLERVAERIERVENRQVRLEERTSFISERIAKVSERGETVGERLVTVRERLESLSPEEAGRVVTTVSETVERVVTRTVEGPGAGSFGDVLGAIAQRVAAGDTQGARALLGEAQGRLDRVNGQLDRISGALGRRTDFFGEAAGRLDAAVEAKIQKELDDDAAARAAAAILGDLTRLGRLFGGEEARPGVLRLFEEGREVPAAKTDDVKPAKEKAGV